MSSSSSRTSWALALPELGAAEEVALDPVRIEHAVEQGYVDGYEAGRTEGYAAGLAEGRAEGLAGLADDRRQLQSVLLALRDQLHRVAAAETEVRNGFTAAVADAAVSLAEAILARELAMLDDPGRDAITRALTAVPTGAEVATVRLHPDDARRLGTVDDLAPGTVLTVVPDPTVAPGDCLLEVGDTRVDASISAALARVREVLST